MCIFQFQNWTFEMNKNWELEFKYICDDILKLLPVNKYFFSQNVLVVQPQYLFKVTKIELVQFI